MEVKKSVREYVKIAAIQVAEGSRDACNTMHGNDSPYLATTGIHATVRLNHDGEVAKTPAEAVSEMTFTIQF